MPLSPATRRERRLKAKTETEQPKPEFKTCKNCPKTFKRNPHKKEHDFCTANCRKEFHRQGGAHFKNLLVLIEKMMADPNSPIQIAMRSEIDKHRDRSLAIEEQTAAAYYRIRQIVDQANAMLDRLRTINRSVKADGKPRNQK